MANTPIHVEKHDTFFQDGDARFLNKEGAELLAEVRDAILALIKKLETISRQQQQHEDRLTKLFTAFPTGDIEGHRRYHETMIEILEEKRKLRRAVQEKTITGLLWAAIVWVGLAVWNYIKVKLGLPPG